MSARLAKILTILVAALLIVGVGTLAYTRTQPKYERRYKAGEVWPSLGYKVTDESLPRIKFPAGMVLLETAAYPAKIVSGGGEYWNLNEIYDCVPEYGPMGYSGAEYSITFLDVGQFSEAMAAIRDALKPTQFLSASPPPGIDCMFLRQDGKAVLTVQRNLTYELYKSKANTITIGLLFISPPSAEQRKLLKLRPL